MSLSHVNVPEIRIEEGSNNVHHSILGRDFFWGNAQVPVYTSDESTRGFKSL